MFNEIIQLMRSACCDNDYKDSVTGSSVFAHLKGDESKC